MGKTKTLEQVQKENAKEWEKAGQLLDVLQGNNEWDPKATKGKPGRNKPKRSGWWNR